MPGAILGFLVIYGCSNDSKTWVLPRTITCWLAGIYGGESSSTTWACLNQAGSGCSLKFLGAQIATKVWLCGPLAPISSYLKGLCTSFQKQIMNHYLHLFVDTVAPIIDHCLQSVWELLAKAFDLSIYSGVDEWSYRFRKCMYNIYVYDLHMTSFI